MEGLAIFLREYGWTTLIALYILINMGKITDWLEGLLSKLWPTFAEQQRLKSERMAAADERVDTIVALKDVILMIRESLRDEKVERRLDKERLYKLIGRHEQLDAQIVEVLRDISEVMRSVSEILGRIAVRVGVYNAKNKKSHN